MDRRSRIPVSLPHPNPTVSYWQDPPDAEIADYGATSTLPDDVVNTVIVGSGITGAGVAWNLLNGTNVGNANGTTNGFVNGDKDKRIVMLEARQACSGATGRNGWSPLSLFQPLG